MSSPGRPLLRRLLLAAPLALLVLTASPALANLRAPGEVPHTPSTALYAPAPGSVPPNEGGVDLVVASEDLVFRCGDQACEVAATYHIRAEAAATLAFEFILPVETGVTARLKGQDMAPTVAWAEPFGPRDAALDQSSRQGRFGADRTPPIFRARFTATLAAGPNELAVTYTQPLGAFERDYGYFKDGRWVGTFQYELWPLKEWKRAADFRLDLRVSMAREAPGWFARTFSTLRSLDCRGGDGPLGAEPTRAPTLEQIGDHLEYRVRLGPDFPDRLHCQLGDEDLVR